MDLKPQNILIFGKICKIGDWGGSIFQKKGSSKLSTMNSQNINFTRAYSSPEFLDHLEEDSKNDNIDFHLCDVYSLGIVILKCCGVPSKKLTNIPKGDEETHDNYIEKLINEYLKKDDRYTKKVYRLVRTLCSFKASKRYSVEKIIKKLEEKDEKE